MLWSRVTGGAVGLTENPAALRHWMISGLEVARLIAEFEASSDTDERMKPGSAKHHKEAKSTQLSLAKDVKSLILVIDDMGNPFTDESGDLLVLDTKDQADASVVKTMEEIKKRPIVATIGYSFVQTPAFLDPVNCFILKSFQNFHSKKKVNSWCCLFKFVMNF